MGGVADGGLHADRDRPVTGPPRRQQHHHVGAIEHSHRGHERAGLDRQLGHHALALPGERVGQHEARRQLVRRRAESPPLRVRIEEDEALFLQDVQEAVRARTRDVAVPNDGAGRCRPTTSQVPQDDQHPPRSAVRRPVRARARRRRPLVTTRSAFHLHAHLSRRLSACRPSIGDSAVALGRDDGNESALPRGGGASSRARRFGRRVRRPCSRAVANALIARSNVPSYRVANQTSTVTDKAPAAALVRTVGPSGRAAEGRCAAPRRRSGPGAGGRKLPPAPARATPHAWCPGRSVAILATSEVRMTMASVAATPPGRCR